MKMNMMSMMNAVGCHAPASNMQILQETSKPRNTYNMILRFHPTVNETMYTLIGDSMRSTNQTMKELDSQRKSPHIPAPKVNLIVTHNSIGCVYNPHCPDSGNAMYNTNNISAANLAFSNGQGM